jgi:hypothetical protein
MFPRRAMEKRTTTTAAVLVGVLMQERKSERTQNKTRAAQQRTIRILLYSVVVAAVPVATHGRFPCFGDIPLLAGTAK